jgi:hypothetical protein
MRRAARRISTDGPCLIHWLRSFGRRGDLKMTGYARRAVWPVKIAGRLTLLFENSSRLIWKILPEEPQRVFAHDRANLVRTETLL